MITLYGNHEYYSHSLSVLTWRPDSLCLVALLHNRGRIWLVVCIIPNPHNVTYSPLHKEIDIHMHAESRVCVLPACLIQVQTEVSWKSHLGRIWQLFIQNRTALPKSVSVVYAASILASCTALGFDSCVLQSCRFTLICVLFFRGLERGYVSVYDPDTRDIERAIYPLIFC